MLSVNIPAVPANVTRVDVKLFDVTLPAIKPVVMFAVFEPNAKLAVMLLAVKFPDSEELPLTVKLPTDKLPLTFPVLAVNSLVMLKLLALTLPDAVNEPTFAEVVTVNVLVRVSPLAFKLAASTLPVKLTLVPVAAPIFGVTNSALALTTMLPPLIVVVISSTFAVNTVPVNAIPFAALYWPPPENCVHTTGVVPTVTIAAVCTQPVSASVEPVLTKVNEPSNSAATFISNERVNMNAVLTPPAVVSVYIPL